MIIEDVAEVKKYMESTEFADRADVGCEREKS